MPNGLLLVGLGVWARGSLARERAPGRSSCRLPCSAYSALQIHYPVAGYPCYWYPVVAIALWLVVLGMSASSERSDTALT
jgi:hypothetical protein